MSLLRVFALVMISLLSATLGPGPAVADEERSYIVGPGLEVLSEGTTEQLEVISHRGVADLENLLGLGEVVEVTMRNNGNESIYAAVLVASLRDGSGALIGAGGTTTVYPGEIRPGEYAFAFLSLAFLGIPPADAELEVNVIGSSEKPEFWEDRSLEVTDVTVDTADGTTTISGTLRNGTSQTAMYPSLVYLCVDEQGLPYDGGWGSMTEQIDELASGESTPFAFEVWTELGCERFIVAAG